MKPSRRRLSVLFAGVTILSLATQLRAEEKPTPQRSTSARLDVLVASSSGHDIADAPATGIPFLRRASFDFVGRPPTVDEQREFVEDLSPDRVSRLIERLLADP